MDINKTGKWSKGKTIQNSVYMSSADGLRNKAFSKFSSVTCSYLSSLLF